MAQQVAGVPRQLTGRMAQEVVRAAAAPQLHQLRLIDVIHPQQRQRLQSVMTYPFAHVRATVHTAAQLFFAGEEQFAQQALLPAVPQVFVGRADIGDRQAEQIA